MVFFFSEDGEKRRRKPSKRRLYLEEKSSDIKKYIQQVQVSPALLSAGIPWMKMVSYISTESNDAIVDRQWKFVRIAM